LARRSQDRDDAGRLDLLPRLDDFDDDSFVGKHRAVFYAGER
jgi:hypothetical protein